MSINYTSHKWGLQLMQQPGYNTLRRYNYMTIWGMPICSCLFQAVNRAAGKKALLSVLGCVQLRPVRRVRRDSVSDEDRPNYASSVSRQLGLFSMRGMEIHPRGQLGEALLEGPSSKDASSRVREGRRPSGSRLTRRDLRTLARGGGAAALSPPV